LKCGCGCGCRCGCRCRCRCGCGCLLEFMFKTKCPCINFRVPLLVNSTLVLADHIGYSPVLISEALTWMASRLSGLIHTYIGVHAYACNVYGIFLDGFAWPTQAPAQP